MELSIWVVYDHPRDYPDKWVARRWVVRDGKEEPTSQMIVTPDLLVIRDAMSELGLTYLPRYASDDPKIFECWI